MRARASVSTITTLAPSPKTGDKVTITPTELTPQGFQIHFFLLCLSLPTRAVPKLACAAAVAPLVG